MDGSLSKELNNNQQKSFLEPLTLSEVKGKHLNQTFNGQHNSNNSNNNENILKCVLCDNEFDIFNDQKDFLAHLLINHKIVIADVKQIGDLRRYIFLIRAQFKHYFII